MDHHSLAGHFLVCNNNDIFLMFISIRILALPSQLVGPAVVQGPTSKDTASLKTYLRCTLPPWSDVVAAGLTV